MQSREKNEARLILVMGIIEQLMTTRKNKIFSTLDINSSQFSLLVHFTHNPTRSWTISELATVMEMNQPGITKLVAVLLEKGTLAAEQDAFDKRKRHLTITNKGLILCTTVMEKLQPEISLLFSALQDDEVKTMLSSSEKLMRWLDEHRI